MTDAPLRFTVSLHRAGEDFQRQSITQENVGDHLDWFFQTACSNTQPLLTWSTAIDGIGTIPIQAERLVAHRAKYLDYMGEISARRGWVQPLVTGYYEPQMNKTHRFTFFVRSAALFSHRLPSERNLETDTIESAVKSLIFSSHERSTPIALSVR